jgi:hypothetical protein
MSPTEFDLRAALRDGEGEGVDPERLIARGRARRAQRRVRLLSTAAIAVVVAGAGVGSAVIWGDGNSNSSNSSGSGGSSVKDGAANLAPHSEQSTVLGRLPAAPNSVTPSGGSAASSGGSCPDSLPRYLLPGGGSPGQFGADGPLFSRPVTSIVVCSYGSQLQALGENPTSNPARLVLNGSQATRLADSLEHASTTKSTYPCPTIRSPVDRELAIIGVAADGRSVGTVTASLTKPACNVQVTNGTAVRYQWQPPADLESMLLDLTPTPSAITKSVPNHSPSGKVHGSPVNS